MLLAAVATVLAGQTAAGGVQPGPPSWGLDRIDQRTGLDHAYHYATDASGVTIYVIDSGVDANHPDFQGRVAPGRDFLNGGSDTTDTNGHGTRLAGIAAGKDYGVAKGAQIVPVRVLDKDGGGATDHIIAGIDWVAQNAQQPAVAVLGIGGVPNDQLDAAVKRLAEVVPVAVPAGSETADASGFSPGRVAEALTVGATDDQDRPDKASNFGQDVDLYAPGVDVPGPIAGGTGAGPESGTSMAAAFAAGVAALYRAQHPETAPAQVDQALVQAATTDVLKGVPDGTANRLLYAPPGT
ncbi:S8 family peptidase [Amycolatopsis sp. SID8362]|uniref:S8 family peptidase n=1 Tax=Amycolatopsis sp. SID8362 TaxID=2690346 RepID=UPI00136F0B04|nr:S8 family peptidase [Amycolatopsis sp. SID8362]NBH05155.1 S8 family serine peptidase [Amycolatopsis sp. SID8362]NED41855.1 S8 family peptidase [Amycolatopsis sp. SID8362]